MVDSQGPHPSSKRGRKIRPLVFSSSRRRYIRKFHYVVEQRTSKKCTKNNVLRVTCADLLFCLERFSYDLEMKTREQNRNNKWTEIERFVWVIRTDTNARGFWLVKRTLGWFFPPFSPNAEPGPRLDVFVAVVVGPPSFRTLFDVRYKSVKVKFLDSRWLWMSMGSIYCFLGNYLMCNSISVS